MEKPGRRSPQACGQAAATAAWLRGSPGTAGLWENPEPGYSAGSSSAAARRRLVRGLGRPARRGLVPRLGRRLLGLDRELGLDAARLVGAPPRASAASASAASAAAAASSSSSGGSSPPSGTTSSAQLGGHVGEDLDRHRVAADPLDRRRRPSLRRSTRIFWSSQSLSATFVAVTEPKSDPVGPALTSNRSSVASSRSAIALRLVGRLRLVARPLRVAPLELAHEPGRRELGEPARQQEVARVAARDVHDLAAQAEALDVLTENDLHRASGPRDRRGRRGRGARRPRGRRGPRPRTAAAPSRARA